MRHAPRSWPRAERGQARLAALETRGADRRRRRAAPGRAATRPTGAARRRDGRPPPQRCRRRSTRRATARPPRPGAAAGHAAPPPPATAPRRHPARQRRGARGRRATPAGTQAPPPAPRPERARPSPSRSPRPRAAPDAPPQGARQATGQRQTRRPAASRPTRARARRARPGARRPGRARPRHGPGARRPTCRRADRQGQGQQRQGRDPRPRDPRRPQDRHGPQVQRHPRSGEAAGRRREGHAGRSRRGRPARGPRDPCGRVTAGPPSPSPTWGLSPEDGTTHASTQDQAGSPAWDETAQPRRLQEVVTANEHAMAPARMHLGPRPARPRPRRDAHRHLGRHRRGAPADARPVMMTTTGPRPSRGACTGGVGRCTRRWSAPSSCPTCSMGGPPMTRPT